MSEQLRDELGKVAYEARHGKGDTLSIWQPWEKLDKAIREEYCIEAEAIVWVLAERMQVHFEHIEQGLGWLKGGIECCLPFPPNGVIIHKEHVLEAIGQVVQSVEACKSVLEQEEA